MAWILPSLIKQRLPVALAGRFDVGYHFLARHLQGAPSSARGDTRCSRAVVSQLLRAGLQYSEGGHARTQMLEVAFLLRQR